jgi:hypothetical protein
MGSGFTSILNIWMEATHNYVIMSIRPQNQIMTRLSIPTEGQKNALWTCFCFVDKDLGGQDFKWRICVCVFGSRVWIEGDVGEWHNALEFFQAFVSSFKELQRSAVGERNVRPWEGDGDSLGCCMFGANFGCPH